MTDREQRLREIRERLERSNDLDFITHVPYLLAEIERLEKRLEEQHEREWSNLEKLATSFRENF